MIYVWFVEIQILPCLLSLINLTCNHIISQELAFVNPQIFDLSGDVQTMIYVWFAEIQILPCLLSPINLTCNRIISQEFALVNPQIFDLPGDIQTINL